MLDVRGVAQPGSASALGAEGREFESHRPDQLFDTSKYSIYLREIYKMNQKIYLIPTMNAGLPSKFPLSEV